MNRNPTKLKRQIVVLNQASNYLTVGICNEMAKRFEHVVLITGNVHEQGEELDERIKIDYILKWKEKHGLRKFLIYSSAMSAMWIKLMKNYRNYEVFFVSVPPMAYLLNIIVPNRFSSLIWDVYPDVMKITGMSESHFIFRIWAKLNRISFKKTYKVLTISDGMADTLGQYMPREKILVQPIWSIFQKNTKIKRINNDFIKRHELNDKFIVQYSGNIGLTHRVEVMLEIAEKLRYQEDILFQIIGRGPRKKVLENLVKEKQLSNCQFLPFQSDEMFPYSLAAADIGVVILDEKTAKGSVPSKSYNLMSYGIPSLYISAKDSELYSYSVRYNHAGCFTENELDKAQEFILRLKTDSDYYKLLALNSLNASKNFKRENARKLVEKYIGLN